MKTFTALLVICLVVVGYLLSPPVAWWLLDRTGRNPTVVACAEVIYFPSGELARHYFPYMELLVFEMELLGIE